MAALALHDELGDVLDRRDAIAAAAAAEPEMRAALAASLAEEAARLALREGEERAPAAEKATDALVDLFGAPSSSQLPPAPTVDASLVDLLSPAETGASGRGSGSPAAEKGESRGDGVGPVRRAFAAPATRARTPRRPVRGVRSLRLVERRNRGYRATAARDPFAAAAAARLRRPAPETRTHSRCATRSRRRRALRGRPTRSRRRAPAARRSGGPRDASRVRERDARGIEPALRRAVQSDGAPMVGGSSPARGGASDSSPERSRSAGGGRRPVRRAGGGGALAGEEPVRDRREVRRVRNFRVTARRWSRRRPSDVSSWGLG